MSNEEPIQASAYSNRTVAFVDILGFKNHTLNARHDDEFATSLIEALREIRRLRTPYNSEETDFRAVTFSDSIIISAHDTSDGIWHVIFAIDWLANTLLDMGILIRGGITIDSAYHEDEIVFGPAVNQAYDIENRIAIYPRVVISANLKTRIDQIAESDKISETYQRSRLRRDDGDGVWYIHQFCNIGIFNRQETGQKPRDHPAYIRGLELTRILQGLVDTTIENPSAYQKICWLAKYWNDEVATNINDGGASRIRFPRNQVPIIRLPFQGLTGEPKD